MPERPSETRSRTSAVTQQEHTRPIPAPHRQRPHFLEQTEGPGAPKRYPLAQETLILGRDEGADLMLNSERVSRKHAVIRRQGLEFSITDLDSSNGIFLNTIKVYSAVLRDGDLLQLADVVFIYHEG